MLIDTLKGVHDAIRAERPDIKPLRIQIIPKFGYLNLPMPITKWQATTWLSAVAELYGADAKPAQFGQAYFAELQENTDHDMLRIG